MGENKSREEMYSWYTNVSGHEKYGVNAIGEVINLKTGRLLKPEIIEGGYKRVLLDGKHYYIHILVAMAFVPNPEEKKYVIHINHDNGDNFYKNLAWSNNFSYKFRVKN